MPRFIPRATIGPSIKMHISSLILKRRRLKECMQDHFIIGPGFSTN